MVEARSIPERGIPDQSAVAKGCRRANRLDVKSQDGRGKIPAFLQGDIALLQGDIALQIEGKGDIALFEGFGFFMENNSGWVDLDAFARRCKKLPHLRAIPCCRRLSRPGIIDDL